MEIHSSPIFQSSKMIRLADTLYVFDQALTKDDCALITDRFERLPFTQCKEGELTEDFQPIAVNPTDNHRLKFKDDFGKEMYTFSNDENKDFDYIVKKLQPFLPTDLDYEIIHFGQIIKYPPDASKPWNLEGMERNDTACVVVELNDGYMGGRIQVDGHLFYPKKGSIICWNNISHRFNGVEPILSGEKYELRLWFGRNDTTQEFLESENVEEIKPKFQDYILPKELKDASVD